jgi:RNA polymerase sigma-32 factor
MTNTSLQKYSFALPIGSLDSYIARISRAPLLSPEEEYDLAVRFQVNQDLEAARELIMSHLRFVVRIARGYKGYGLAQEDLIQEGNIGLMKAVKRFDPDMGVRLVSFAVHWIKAEIHEFILRNWRIVKVATTKAQRKLFFNLRKATKRMDWFTDEEVQAVAKDLNVKPEEVRHMETRMNAHDETFESFSTIEDDQPPLSPEHYLEDNRYNPAKLYASKEQADTREQHLHQVMSQLDERSRFILYQRWLVEDKATLHELAAKYNVSAERIRQIEKMAMEKIKKAGLE